MRKLSCPLAYLPLALVDPRKPVLAMAVPPAIRRQVWAGPSSVSLYVRAASFANAAIALAALSLVVPDRTLAQEGELGPASSECDPEALYGPTACPSSDFGEEQTEPVSLSDEQALHEETAEVERADDGLDPTELRDQDYFFVGLMFRGMVIPSYVYDIAQVKSPQYEAPFDGQFGAFFNYRRNSFNIQAETFYQSFGWQGFIRGNGEPDEETEWIKSNLGVLFVSLQVSWAFDILPWFAIEVGLGLGFGATIGDLYRQEAYIDGGSYQRCDDLGVPDQAFCGSPDNRIEAPNPDNGRLDSGRIRGATMQWSQGTPNPFYFGEGGVPPIFGTLDLPRVAARFKPIKQLQLRVELAHNLYAWTFGLSAAYGF